MTANEDFATSTTEQVGGDKWLLALIFLAAAALRFYSLDVPSMEWSEIVVAIMAKTPVDYIFRWSSGVEVHPPYFYLLTKAVLLFLDSDFGLKSVSCLASLVTVWYSFRLGRGNAGARVGLLCAALMAINPVIIDSARIIRPHALVVMFETIALCSLFDWLRERRAGALGVLFAADLLGLMFHYMMLVVMIAQAAIIIIDLSRRRELTFKSLVFLGAGCVACFLPISWFFLRTVLSKNDQLLSSWSYSHVLLQLYDAYSSIFSSALADVFDNGFQGLLSKLICLAALIWALTKSIRERNQNIFSLLIFITVPFVFLLITRHGYVFYRYIQIVLPAFFVLLAGLAVAVAPRRSIWFMTLGLLALGFYNQYVWAAKYYSDVAIYREAAQGLAQALGPLEMPGFVSNGDREAVNHYYSQIVHDNRITNTRLSPEDSTTAFTLVGDSFFHYALNKDELFEKMGSPESTLTGKSNVYKWRVQREPLKHITAIPWSFEASLTPREFLRDVSSYERISFNSHFGDGVSPSLMNETGRLEFAFENATTKQNMLISLKLRYENLGTGNVFRVLACFDEEEPQTVFLSQGRDPLRTAFLYLPRQTSFKHLRIIVEMHTKTFTPIYSGSNVSTVRLKGLRMVLHGYEGDMVNGHPASYMAEVLNSGDSLDMGAKGMLKPLRHEPILEQGLVVRSELAGPTLTPLDGERGSVSFTSLEPLTHFYFMPGLEENASIRVKWLAPEGDIQIYELQGMPTIKNDPFSPHLVRLPRIAPSGSRFSVELAGRKCRVWQRDGELFYSSNALNNN